MGAERIIKIKLEEVNIKNANFYTHPHGIKVMLENGIVGRVKEIMN